MGQSLLRVRTLATGFVVGWRSLETGFSTTGVETGFDLCRRPTTLAGIRPDQRNNG
jgi:hypothetical protein